MFLETRAARISYVAGLTLVLTGLGFWAAVEVGLPISTRADAAMSDAPFAKSAKFAELEDVRFSLLAQERADSDRVRSFAAEMLAENSQASEDLNRAAWRENLSLPGNLAAKDEATYKRLSIMDAAQFDKAYMQEMVQELIADVQVYRREASKGNDEVIRSYALETLPVLEKHLKEARAVLKKVAPADRKPWTGHAARFSSSQGR
jgi:putative membrane protein